MLPILFAAAGGPDDVQWGTIGIVAGAIAAVVILLIFLFIFFSFVGLWIQSMVAGAGVGMFDMVKMRLLKLDYTQVVKMKIALVQAGVKASTEELEQYLLANGKKLESVVQAVIAAHKAGMDLPWGTAAAIQLAGRDIYKAVQVSVNPEVIDCPVAEPQQAEQHAGRRVQERHSAQGPRRVTVRTKLDRLVGGPRRRRSSPASARASSRPSARPSTTPTCWPTPT